MKKTIVIVILAVYIASIALLNFVGLKVTQTDSKHYVETIQCDKIIVRAENYKEVEPEWLGKTPMFTFDFIPADPDNPYTEENIMDNPNVIILDYQVMPFLADETNVEFVYDKDSGVAVYDELSNSFVFLKSEAMLNVTIRATDGHNASTTIKIYSRDPNAE